jgi:hypothetical protein
MYRETGTSATLATRNPIWTGMASNPVLRGEKPANNFQNISYLKEHCYCFTFEIR